ncbi:MAG: permease [Prolixibacteraceae bacterium]|nr:permease [Prolixibacteraceae bacterium]
MVNFLTSFFSEFWVLLTEMGPYLLFGFLFAGLLHIFMQKERVGKMLNGNNARSVFNATLLGIPLPLCSCGVIPAGLSFHKNGASKGSTVSFLISTPQTGVDSILATYSLLGLPFAIIRPLVALFTGITGGLAATAFSGKRGAKNYQATYQQIKKPFFGKLKEVFVYGFYDLIRDISKWLIIGLLLAALLAVIIPDDFFTRYINMPWLNIFIVLLASVPLYICATGSIPIAAVLLMKGLSPGAALVFLMAGPATNIATLTVLWKELGKRSTMIYLATIIGGAVFFGFLIDILLPVSWFKVSEGHVHHHFLPGWIGALSAVILTLLVLNVYVQRIFNARKKRKIIISKNTDMSFIKYKVEGMTCKNCKAHVERAVSEVQGVSHALADHVNGELTVTGENINHENIRIAVKKAGYTYAGMLK